MNDKRLTDLTEMHERGTVRRGHIDEMLAELRRLYAINAEMLGALQILFERANRNSIDPFALQQAVDAITKATGEAK